MWSLDHVNHLINESKILFLLIVVIEGCTILTDLKLNYKYDIALSLVY